MTSQMTDRVLEAVCTAYEVTRADVLAYGRGRPEALDARHVAMWLLRVAFGWSLPTIAREMNRRHHATALWAIRRIEAQMALDPDHLANRLLPVVAPKHALSVGGDNDENNRLQRVVAQLTAENRALRSELFLLLKRLRRPLGESPHRQALKNYLDNFGRRSVISEAAS